ncbi:hypothetical protein IFM89_000560 [Coptis chinensis]|uniref:DUF1664 domain-containing protein n=1 Tax=Coptis chinensis TaxID=261450 RepID=A0A835M6F3_9MAGN|nr:hypothetical protein IFM89_000560 [Coptis chinensis]
MAQVLPLGKITLLIGAGIIGSVLAQEGRTPSVSDIFSGTFKFWKRIRRDDSPSSRSKPQNDSLLAQVTDLKRELEQLINHKPIIIVPPGKSGGVTYGVPIFVVVVGCGCLWWKGWKLSDMMFATRRGLSDACSSVAKQLDQVSSSISAAKRFLSQRIDRVDANIDECAELTAGTRDEVSQLRGDMRVFSVDVESVHRAVKTLESKIGRIEDKQDATTYGVSVLCDFVQTLESSRTSPSIQASPASISKPSLERPQIALTSRTCSLPPKVLSLESPSPSSSNESPKVTRPLPSTISASGLKELDGIYDAISTSSGMPQETSVAEENGSSSTGIFGWKVPSLKASLLSRTNSATLSFK